MVLRRKHIIALGAVALMLSASPVLADDHGGEGKGGPFVKHDTNGDGVISKSEFLSHAEERFKKMDADGNGEVSKEEARAGHKKMRENMKERGEKMRERRQSRESAAE